MAVIPKIIDPNIIEAKNPIEAIPDHFQNNDVKIKINITPYVPKTQNSCIFGA